jgi:hypothetical protein
MHLKIPPLNVPAACRCSEKSHLPNPSKDFVESQIKNANASETQELKASASSESKLSKGVENHSRVNVETDRRHLAFIIVCAFMFCMLLDSIIFVVTRMSWLQHIEPWVNAPVLGVISWLFPRSGKMPK